MKQAMKKIQSFSHRRIDFLWSCLTQFSVLRRWKYPIWIYKESNENKISSTMAYITQLNVATTDRQSEK